MSIEDFTKKIKHLPGKHIQIAHSGRKGPKFGPFFIAQMDHLSKDELQDQRKIAVGMLSEAKTTIKKIKKQLAELPKSELGSDDHKEGLESLAVWEGDMTNVRKATLKEIDRLISKK